MSIKADVQELESIRNELKRLTIKRKELKEKEGKITDKIIQYLKIKNAPGIKHQGIAVLIQEKKEKKQPKKLKQTDVNSVEVLKKYVVENEAEKVLQEILEVRKRKPESEPKPKLKIEKYEN